MAYRTDGGLPAGAAGRIWTGCTMATKTILLARPVAPHVPDAIAIAPSRLGPVARACLLAQLALLVVAALLCQVTGLSVAWRTFVPYLIFDCCLFGLWAHVGWNPRSETDRLAGDLLLAIGLILLLTDISTPTQYAAVALRRPLADEWLAAADAMIGVNVPALVHWTANHPAVADLLRYCYFSLLPQLVLTPIVLALVFRQSDRLWEYVFHFHFCLLVTLAGLALLPAACAFTYYGFHSTLDQTHFIRQFAGFRDGTLTLIRFDDLEGLISMPSFHVAGALMVTWAFRGRRTWLIPIGAVNLGLVAATVMTGAHYGVDLVATLFVFATSVWMYRAWRKGTRAKVDRLLRRHGLRKESTP